MRCVSDTATPRARGYLSDLECQNQKRMKPPQQERSLAYNPENDRRYSMSLPVFDLIILRRPSPILIGPINVGGTSLRWMRARGPHSAMTAVVEDQEDRFRNDEKLKILSRGETPIVYRAIPFGPTDERRRRFLLDTQQLQLSVTIPSLGLNFDFHLSSVENRETALETVTYFESSVIFNGVCVKWIGHIGQSSLQGAGHFVYDSERANALNQLRQEEARYQSRINALYNRFQLSGQ